MRICIDVDGVICHLRKPEQHYSELEPIEGAVRSIQELKEEGHYIILHTARHMRTCNGDVGMVIAKQGKTLLDWLDRFQIPYDEIYFGKPIADVYIDDNALRFRNWRSMNINLGIRNKK
jgi:capsule biosynthesis phosphatase